MRTALLGVSASHPPFPRKGTETLNQLTVKTRFGRRSHPPFPRKGTETFIPWGLGHHRGLSHPPFPRKGTETKSVAGLVESIEFVTPTFSPQGDGNLGIARAFWKSKVVSSHPPFPRKGTETTALLQYSYPIVHLSHTHLFPARGRKHPSKSDRRLYLFSSHTHLFPARGRKHSEK